MSFTKTTTTTYTVTIEVQQTLPDELIENIKTILADTSWPTSPKIKAMRYLRNEVEDLCGTYPSLRDAKDIVEDIMDSMPKPTLGDIKN